MPLPSTFTPLDLLTLPDKGALTDAFVGKSISALRTPALIVDRDIFKGNCERVTSEAKGRGMKFRAHVKTHKTNEGVKMQVEASGGVKALIASTMPEVWQIVMSGLVQQGKVEDILYSMPISASRLEDLNDCQEKCGSHAVIRLMVDHVDQIRALDSFNKKYGRKKPWSVFMKVDGGGRRAGVPPQSEQMRDNVKAALESEHVEIFGFYSRELPVKAGLMGDFGQSYASHDLSEASKYFAGEVDCVNSAAQVARELGAKGNFVLSVGATPTAHAATLGADLQNGLEGEFELHAGCYCMNDCQQMATSLVPPENVAISVLATVVSEYPHRKEAMCDAGALAVSKDTGPWAGYGRVVWPEKAKGWDLGRVSQEHGTLVHRPKGDSPAEELKVGDQVRIVPQHACLACASYPWLYVVEKGGDTVVDVWVTWKGW